MNTPEHSPVTSDQEVSPVQQLTTNEVEIAPAPAIHPMELLLSENPYDLRELEVGDTIEGTIVGINDSEILVDIGSKSEGVIPARDLERVDAEIRNGLKIGDKIYAQVVRPESREGHATLSLSRALQEYDWKHAEDLLESQQVFEGEVNGYNKGGVIVFVGKARGFVPASQLVSDEGKKDDDDEDRFASLVGKKLQLKVIELDRTRNRLILSERQAMRDWRRKQKAKLLTDLQVGDVRNGMISSLASFGAFVDLGGADGLIHLSELSWGRVQDPSEVVRVGDEVRVKVISVDRERRRIGLSMRQLMPEPWSVVHEQYAIGQLVDAEITRLTSFGAFARVDGKLEGLIHISELSDQRINHPKEVVHEGQKLMLRVIKIDPDKRRMGLSLKRAGEDSYAVMDWAAEETDDLMEEDQTSMAAAMADAEMAADAELEAGAGSVSEAELEADAEMTVDAGSMSEAELAADAEMMVDAGSMSEAELEADAEMMVDAEAEEATVV